MNGGAEARANGAAGASGRDRVLTIPNALSVIRLILVPVFLYLLLVADAVGVALHKARARIAAEWERALEGRLP